MDQLVGHLKLCLTSTARISNVKKEYLDFLVLNFPRRAMDALFLDVPVLEANQDLVVDMLRPFKDLYMEVGWIVWMDGMCRDMIVLCI